MEIDIPEYGAYEIIMMLDELHKRGYQQLRLLPSAAPNGISWKWAIYPKLLMGNNNEFEKVGSHVPFESPHGSTFISKLKKNYVQMADLFIEKHYYYLELGKKPDPEYVEWFQIIVEHAQRGDYPHAYSDYHDFKEWEFGSRETLRYPPF